jgi:hypothetical protein
MLVEKLKEMVQHTHESQVPNWQPTTMWIMANTYRKTLQNKNLSYFNRTGSEQTRQSGYALVQKSLWLLHAKKHNDGEEEKGRTCRYDLHLPKANYTNMKLLGVVDYTICNGSLNVANSIVKVTGGGDGHENAGQSNISPARKLALSKRRSLYRKHSSL